MVHENRGWAGPRQVPNVKHAVQHNVGLGGAVVVALYRRYEKNQTTDPIKIHGYNPAVQSKNVSEALVKKVMSQKGSLLGTVNQLSARL